MHEKAIKTQKTLTNQFSLNKKVQNLWKMDEIESEQEMRMDLDLEIEPKEPNECVFT